TGDEYGVLSVERSADSDGASVPQDAVRKAEADRPVEPGGIDVVLSRAEHRDIDIAGLQLLQPRQEQGARQAKPAVGRAHTERVDPALAAAQARVLLPADEAEAEAGQRAVRRHGDE